MRRLQQTGVGSEEEAALRTNALEMQRAGQ